MLYTCTYVYVYLYYTEGPNGEVGQGNRFYHCYFNTSIRDRGIQLAGPVDFTFHLGVKGMGDNKNEIHIHIHLLVNYHRLYVM